MAKNNHTCIVCGTAYRYCPNCKDYANYPRWMSMFCGQNCHDIFEVANAFENGAIAKDKAIEKFGKLNLSMRKNFKGSLKETVDKALGIMVEDNKVEVKPETKVETEVKNEIKADEIKEDLKVNKVENKTVKTDVKNFDKQFKGYYGNKKKN